jgi:hypothetical protein
MSTTNLKLKESAASELAWWLRCARRYLAESRPRVCVDCSCCFVVASANSPLRCWVCGIRAAEGQQ